MKHFKDNQNKIYAYETDGSQDNFILPNLTPISDAEANAIRNPIKSIEQIRLEMPALSAWQVRKVLTMFGLRAQVESAILVSDDTTKDAWAYAKEFERNDPLLNGMANVLGISAFQLDQFFNIGITL